MSMPKDPYLDEVAEALQESLRLFLRRLRQVQVDDEDLTMPQRTALSRLDRGGPATSAALARQEQISAQSMWATLSALEDNGLIERKPDPNDGRSVVMSVTDAGREVLRSRRNAKTEQMARALADDFTRAEIDQLKAAAPLIARLAKRI